ncbi:MAG: phosphodiester glycosidase family protein [Ruminococcus sp.]|nr:phosphodiester glycosidase family protein [Ruminococcus sp.]
MFKRKSIFVVMYSIILISFTIYVLLDTFVIARVEQVVQAPESTQETTTSNDTQTETTTANIDDNDIIQESITTTIEQQVTISENYYSDGNVTIELKEYREYDTTIYVAEVILSSAEYLKTAFAQNSYGHNVVEKTSEISERVGAILAINGDFYGTQEKGYVIRNGVLYRDTASSDQEDLVIYKDGSFEIINEDELSAETLLENNAQQVLSFGPALVINNTISVSENDEVGKAKASNPRTAIGIMDSLHYFFVVSDGRTSESVGLSLYELATFMQSLGIETAYNLDGGGSSTMVFNGNVVNNPTTNGKSIKERSVSDIVYIG